MLKWKTNKWGFPEQEVVYDVRFLLVEPALVLSCSPRKTVCQTHLGTTKDRAIGISRRLLSLLLDSSFCFLDHFYLLDRFLLKNVSMVRFLGGSLLLAGRPGLGRADAIRLIANMHQMALFTPKITPSYGQKQIDQELKNVGPMNFF